MILRFCFYFVLLSVLVSCASQVAPTGGDKDIIPPIVVKANPENLITNFKSGKISLTFSEFVQLNDPANQIFVSPALSAVPEFRLRGKTLSIVIPDSLKTNTTYTINFGNAIKDIREGNIMQDFQYVFSTGPAIDSFRIQGKITNARDGSVKPNIMVMLYTDLTDSIVTRSKPEYNARTDSSGYFVLSYLRGGEFKLFALDDQNFNLLYDQPGEMIAFLDSTVLVNDTIAFYQLSIFKPEAEEQSILNSFSRQPGKISIAFAKPVQQFQVSVPGKSDELIFELNNTADTVNMWVNSPDDSLSLSVRDTEFVDTIKVRMKAPETKQRITSGRFTVSPATGKGLVQLTKGEPLLFEFSSPVIAANDKRKITLRDDSSRKEVEVHPYFIHDSVTHRKRGVIGLKLLENTGYTLVIPDSAFNDFMGNYNDSVLIPLRLYSTEDLGNFSIDVSFADSLSKKNYFYELKNSQGKLISKRSLSPPQILLKFNSLPPGNYTLRLVEDANMNSEWDTGNYWRHMQPERIFPYPAPINIRANWDVELKMKVNN